MESLLNAKIRPQFFGLNSERLSAILTMVRRCGLQLTREHIRNRGLPNATSFGELFLCELVLLHQLLHSVHKIKLFGRHFSTALTRRLMI